MTESELLRRAERKATALFPSGGQLDGYASRLRDRIIIVMLTAGNKSSQKRDIRRALKLAAELGEDQ